MIGRVSAAAVVGLLVLSAPVRADAPPRPSILLESGRASVVALDSDLTGASSGDPGIVDVQVVGQHQLLLNPKRAGTTQIVLWDPQQRTSFYDVNVTPGAPVVVRNGAPKTDGDSLRIRFQVGQSRLIDTDFNAARVVVTDSDLADVQVITPRQILINGKNPGVTSLIIWTTEGKSVFYDLEVSVNTDLLRERLANALPDARVEIEAARAGVILSGEVADLDQLNKALTLARAYSDQVTNLLRVGGSQQVQLEVRIAEVSRTALRKAGINLFTQSGKWTLGVFGPGTAIGDAAVIPPSLSSQPTFFDTFQLAVGATKDMASIISLLESQGLSKTLASPTLVALSGQEASFLVGGEFPIPVSQKDGAITIEFKEFGVKLRFTPTVIGRDLISMKVAPEVSDIDFTSAINVGGVAVPGVTSRRAETTVELRDGQSFAIAGLLSDRIVSRVDRVPFLGSLPILGALFRSVQHQREETELVILVSPRLAAPLPAGQTPRLPGEGQSFDPDDYHLFLLGVVEEPAREELNHKGAAAGPAGQLGLAD